MKSSVGIIKFLFKNDWSPLGEVTHSHGLQHDLISARSESELLSAIRNLPAALIMASVSDKSELVSILSFVKANKVLIKSGQIKLVAVNFLSNKQVELALLKIGCQEVLDPDIRGKLLKFKIDFWLKPLNLFEQKLEESTLEKPDYTVSPNPVLKIQDDIWSVKNTKAEELAYKDLSSIIEAMIEQEDVEETHRPKETAIEMANVKSYVKKLNDSSNVMTLCRFDDFYDGEIFVWVGNNHFNQLDRIAISLSVDYNGHHYSLESDGVITNVTQEAGECLLSIKVTEANAGNVIEFMEVYKLRQTYVTSFMRAVRGY